MNVRDRMMAKTLPYSRLLLKALLLFSLIVPWKGALAQSGGCLPGIPCIVDATPNDPDDPNDGPNKVGPNKPKSDVKSCDADFMNQIYGKAFLEANRETMMNQAIIRKPDSVLEYTCFGGMVKKLKDYAPSLFSERGHMGFTVPARLPMLLSDLIDDALGDYISGQFGHTFLGGQSGLDYNAGGGTCDYMNTVFREAKCTDFNDATNMLAFRTFKDFVGGLDPRRLPKPCEGEKPIKQDHIDLADNKGFKYVNFDKTKTWLKFLQNSPCDAPAVPTGVIIRPIEVRTDVLGNPNAKPLPPYIDKVCPNPGCHFTGPGGSCVP